MKKEILTIDKICALVRSEEYEVYLVKDNLYTKAEEGARYWNILYSGLPSSAEMVVYVKPLPKPTPPPVTAEVIVDGRTYRLVEES